MKNYLKLLKKVLSTGESRQDRTGTGTDIDSFKYEHVVLKNYNSHTTIKAPISV